MKVYTKTVTYENAGDRIKLIAFGDVHVGAANCDMDGFQQMLKQHGRKKDTYLIDMGDACDMIIQSDSKRFRLSTIHRDFIQRAVESKEGESDFEIIEDIVDEEIKWYVKTVQKYCDTERFLGIVSGNHHETIHKRHGSNPTKRIAEALGCENLGYCFFFRLLFKKEGSAHKELIIYGHHGWGGGSRTEGYNVTKYCKDARRVGNANIFLYGHTHDLWVKPLAGIKPVRNKVKDVPVYVFQTGTFLKTYSKGVTPSYAEQGGMPARALGYVEIEITTPTEAEPYFGLKGLV